MGLWITNNRHDELRLKNVVPCIIEKKSEEKKVELEKELAALSLTLSQL